MLEDEVGTGDWPSCRTLICEIWSEGVLGLGGSRRSGPWVLLMACQLPASCVQASGVTGQLSQGCPRARSILAFMALLWHVVGTWSYHSLQGPHQLGRLSLAH